MKSWDVCSNQGGEWNKENGWCEWNKKMVRKPHELFPVRIEPDMAKLDELSKSVEAG